MSIRSNCTTARVSDAGSIRTVTNRPGSHRAMAPGPNIYNFHVYHCKSCKVGVPMADIAIPRSGNCIAKCRHPEPPVVSTIIAHCLMCDVQFHSTDSARSVGRFSKLITNQLRDHLALRDISFADATCNLRDIETKKDGPLSILSEFSSACRFIIFFVGVEGDGGRLLG